MPTEESRGEEARAWKGVSTESLDDALKRAVGASDVPPGSMLIISQLAVRTEGDPNIGTYHVTVTPGG